MARRLGRFPLVAAGLILWAAASASGWAAPQTAAPAPPHRDGDGSLENASFEGSFDPWQTWWVPGGDNCALQEPEFIILTMFGDDQLHVAEGHDAVRIAIDDKAYWAGVYQQVKKITPGTILEFSVYGQMDANLGSDTTPSNLSGSPDLRAGIDPTGGTSPTSENIVWSSPENRYDSYYKITVTTTALGETITVFASAHPTVCQANNNAFFDRAQLKKMGVGPVPTATVAATATVQATNAPTAAPANTNAPTSAVVATQGPLLTPTPGEDGAVVYTVQSGDSLTSIAFAAGLTVQELQTLNGLTDTNILIGQKLILATAAPTATDSPPPTDTERPPTEAPPTIAPTAAQVNQTGQICVAMFEDSNGDGLHGPEEAFMAGGKLELSAGGAGVVESYETTGIDEPHCFTDLQPATYLVVAAGPENYTFTKDDEIGVLLPPEGDVMLEFGARRSAASSTGLLAAIGTAVLLLGGGAAGFVVFRRRRAK